MGLTVDHAGLRGNKKNDLDSYSANASSTTTTASVLVHYGGRDACPSQRDVRRRVRAHYEDDFGAEHVELPAVRTYNFFPHWEDTLVGYHWNLYHIQVKT